MVHFVLAELPLLPRPVRQAVVESSRPFAYPLAMSRHRLLAALAVLIPCRALAADWHVAPNGVDGAAGSAQAPLATFAHAVSRAASGDRLLLQRGGRYVVNDQAVSGLEVGAYGDGAAPILTASLEVELSGTWANNPNVRTGPVADPVLATYVDGRFVPLARYPNAPTFLRVDNDDSPDAIVDGELATRPGVAAGRWTGAQVRWRRWSWWWETRPITEHAAPDTLLLGPEGRFQDPFSDPGSGYFIDNDLDELDAPGEWMWQAGTLYLYPPAWANPGTMRVTVVTSDAPGLRAANASFTDLELRGFTGAAVEVNRPTSFTRCTFAELETDGIRFTWDAQPLVVRESVFRDVRNVAISGWANAAGATGTLIERNLFLRVGVERGYGGSGSWHAAGVIIGQANGARVRLNRFVDIGYAGVILGSDGQTVERNLFVRTMATLNDGAAIYTNCNASVMRENIILDPLGDLETSHPWWPLGHGIWPEFLSDFADSVITDNTVYGANGFGLFLPNNFTCTVSGNVVVDNRRAGFDLSGDGGDDQGHTITGNTLAAVVPSRRLVRPENLNQWWLPPYAPPTPVALSYQPGLDYGTMRATTFIAPATDAAVIRPEGGTDLDDLAAWTAAAPTWSDATDSRVVRAHAILLFNDTEAPATVPVPPGSWTRPDGSAAGAAVDLAPFRSQVLISSTAAPTSPPYYAASGIDWRAVEPVSTVLGADPPPPDGGASDGGALQGDGGLPGADGGPPGGSTDRLSGLSGGCGCRAFPASIGVLLAAVLLGRRRRG